MRKLVVAAPLIPAQRRVREVVAAPTVVSSRKVMRCGLSVTGVGLCAVFYCLAYTPSLLPRPWLLQGVVAGLTASFGYAGGTAIGAVVRLRWWPSRRVERIAWRVLLVLVPPLILLFLWLGTRWQRDLRVRLGMSPQQEYDLMRTVGISILTFGVLLLLARSLRLAAHGLARLFGRLVPESAAYCAGFVVVTVLSYTAFDGLLVTKLYTSADRSAAITDSGTGNGVVQPASALRSGSRGSLVTWDSLGRQGRNFVTSAPPVAELAGFSGRAALDPIRIYAGLSSAETVQDRAALVVREMDRTRAWDRSVIAVFTPTGTGWVDNDVPSSLEYMYSGDTALVSMQYSYLPSWISFAVDRSKVVEAASALIGAVRERLALLPAGDRPKLLIFGESLGTYGTEKTFGTAAAMVEGADGILLEGPMFANPVHRELTAGRAPGSPVWDPSYPGLPVEFASESHELRELAGTHRKVVYMQNSSDPVVWWSPSLLWHQPEWLKGTRGPHVTPDMHWYPVITFWQTTVDLLFANKAPVGHGHVYKSGAVDGWAALAPPPGWTVGDTVRLRALLDS
ncbi:alpha/beta hydrolase [Paractinoplanes brasiliensis]|uniref:Putative membrane protein n=1 Tax=Paractinoplanes brasiliensis TaxID=52695 RepID=A0A4R6JW98_9ACTN|nr:alpha/beta-hydrolase family protein [Actinoplanes brasiliensis]TDO40969.1 putative membrane protein [Actinoplanes brasiliensis]GID26037.1 membrane protein [Actinoplanes brasiliensis]